MKSNISYNLESKSIEFVLYDFILVQINDFDICSFHMPRPQVPACFGFTIVLSVYEGLDSPPRVSNRIYLSLTLESHHPSQYVLLEFHSNVGNNMVKICRESSDSVTASMSPTALYSFRRISSTASLLLSDTLTGASMGKLSLIFGIFSEQSASLFETRKRPPFKFVQRIHLETCNQFKTYESEGRSSIKDVCASSVRRQLRQALLSELTM